MTQEKQDLIELKIHYDNLKKQQDALVKEREKLLKEQNQLLNRGLSRFFLFRFVQVITRPVFQFIKGVLGMPPNDREIQLDAIASKGDIISESLKNVESQIKAINKQQLKDRSFDTITDNDLTEYRNNVVLKETEINKIRVESQKNPSMILKEFSQIKGWDEPINKHKVLDFVLEKKDFIDKFRDAYKKGDVAFEYDGKKYTSFQDDDFRTIYSDEVDIKDIEAALSYALGQDIVFDFNSMRYVGETFECRIDGTITSVSQNGVLPEQTMVLKEYAERLSETIEKIAKEKHPNLLTGKTKDAFIISKDKFDTKHNVSNDKSDISYYQGHKDALSILVANKCFVESKIVTEFNSIKVNKKSLQPEKIMDYLFAKNNFLKEHPFIKDDGLSFNVTKDNSFAFANSIRGKYKSLDTYVGIKDIESALTYITQTPIHYDFQANTFKSSLFEVDADGNFLHSETMPSKEYKQLSKFFKEYGKTTSDLFREIARRDAPSLLFSSSQFKTDGYKETLETETETKKERYEESRRTMERQGKRVHKEELTDLQDVAPDVVPTKAEYSSKDYKNEVAGSPDLENKQKDHTTFSDEYSER